MTWRSARFSNTLRAVSSHMTPGGERRQQVCLWGGQALGIPDREESDAIVVDQVVEEVEAEQEGKRLEGRGRPIGQHGTRGLG